jgi:hypothetical protein
MNDVDRHELRAIYDRKHYLDAAEIKAWPSSGDGGSGGSSVSRNVAANLPLLAQGKLGIGESSLPYLAYFRDLYSVA